MDCLTFDPDRYRQFVADASYDTLTSTHHTFARSLALAILDEQDGFYRPGVHDALAQAGAALGWRGQGGVDTIFDKPQQRMCSRLHVEVATAGGNQTIFCGDPAKCRHPIHRAGQTALPPGLCARCQKEASRDAPTAKSLLTSKRLPLTGRSHDNPSDQLCYNSSQQVARRLHLRPHPARAGHRQDVEPDEEAFVGRELPRPRQHDLETRVRRARNDGMFISRPPTTRYTTAGVLRPGAGRRAP